MRDLEALNTRQIILGTPITCVQYKKSGEVSSQMYFQRWRNSKVLWRRGSRISIMLQKKEGKIRKRDCFFAFYLLAMVGRPISFSGGSTVFPQNRPLLSGIGHFFVCTLDQRNRPKDSRIGQIIICYFEKIFFLNFNGYFITGSMKKSH